MSKGSGIIIILFMCIGVLLIVSGKLYEENNRLVDEANNYTAKYSALYDSYVYYKNYSNRVYSLNVEIHSYATQLGEINERAFNETMGLKDDFRRVNNKFKEYRKRFFNVDGEYSWRKINNYTWTGCRYGSTKIKACKGCNWDLLCSESMRPTFSCENTLYFCKTTKGELKVGDIINFGTPEYDFDWVVHRIIAITDEGYITRGDNNDYKDHYVVKYEDINGKLFRIEG